MSLAKRIKLAAKALVGKSTGTLGLNDLWLRGGYMGDVSAISTSDYVAAAYSSSAIAYACIDRMAKDAAGVPLVFLSDPEDMEAEVSDTDPVRVAFERPASGYTMRRLVGWTTMMRQLRGECLWYLPDVSPRRIETIVPWYDPRYWREVVDKEQGLVGWEFKGRGEQFVAMAEQVLWIGQDNPNSPYRGVSPLQAAARALGIDVMGDSLQEDMVRRGGERGLVLSSDAWLTDEQYEQVVRNLQARRPGPGQASRDFIIDGGGKLENPDFTKEDIDFLAWQNAAKDKICHVYGMAPVLIGDDDAAQFKSAPEAIKLYWQQTLIPLLRSYEDAWDNFFVRRHGLQTYVRFDLSRVSALKADELANATVAKIYWDMLLPFASINDKLGLGFDADAVAFVDGMDVTSRKPAPPMAPANGQGGSDDQPEEEPAKSRNKGLTNAVIKARAADARFRAQRVRRMARLERSTWNAIKGVASDYQEKTMAATKQAFEEFGFSETGARMAAIAIENMGLDFGSDLAEAVTPGHTEAAQIGSASVQELVDGKFLAWHDRVKAVSFAPNTERAMAQRRAWLREYSGPGWMSNVKDIVMSAVKEAAAEGSSIGSVMQAVREAWGGWSRSHAETIARTEVGTIYNTARYDEMDAQEFTKHEWVTSIDESTRDSHRETDGQIRTIGDPFDVGGVRMAYPQEVGAPAGEVINCRCETIPVVED